MPHSSLHLSWVLTLITCVGLAPTRAFGQVPTVAAQPWVRVVTCSVDLVSLTAGTQAFVVPLSAPVRTEGSAVVWIDGIRLHSSRIAGGNGSNTYRLFATLEGGGSPRSNRAEIMGMSFSNHPGVTSVGRGALSPATEGSADAIRFEIDSSNSGMRTTAQGIGSGGLVRVVIVYGPDGQEFSHQTLRIPTPAVDIPGGATSGWIPINFNPPLIADGLRFVRVAVPFMYGYNCCGPGGSIESRLVLDDGTELLLDNHLSPATLSPPPTNFVSGSGAMFVDDGLLPTLHGRSITSLIWRVRASGGGRVAVNAGDTHVSFYFRPARACFRSSDAGSWDGGPIWNHVGMFYQNGVYESYPAITPDLFWDPLEGRVLFPPYQSINGVQRQHTFGSFVWDTASQAQSSATNATILLEPIVARSMISYIEDQMTLGREFRYFCDSSSTPSLGLLGCVIDRLQPSMQKGAAPDFEFTCCGLLEAAAENAGVYGGQGYLPDNAESFRVYPNPFDSSNYYVVPTLSPLLLKHGMETGGMAGIRRWLMGWFDPVDFLMIDPLGNRIGNIGGTVNEIPGALYSGSSPLQQVIIPDPLPGTYIVQLQGVGEDSAIAVGGAGGNLFFQSFLDLGESRELVLVIPCPGDLDGNNSVGLADLAILLGNFGESNSAVYADGDMDGTGTVDLSDLSALLSAFGSSCP